MILAIGPALISITFPPEQLGRVLGIQAIMTYIGLSLGPVMGGWLTQLGGWKATFFVTVPFALAGLLLGIWAIPQVVMERHKQLDAKGIIFFMIGIASLTLLLNADMIKQQRALIMPLLLILFVGAAWGFLKIERDQPDPTIDIKLFRIRNFAFGTIGAALNYLCFFLALFLLPFYLDHVLHFSAAKIGTYLTLPPIVMTICAPIAGALSDNIGPRVSLFGHDFQHSSTYLVWHHGPDVRYTVILGVDDGVAFNRTGNGNVCCTKQFCHFECCPSAKARNGFRNFGHVSLHRHDGRKYSWRFAF